MQEADTGRSDRASSADGIEGDTRKGANTPDAFAASYTSRVLFIKDGAVFNELRCV